MSSRQGYTVGVLCTNRLIHAGLKAMLAEAESVGQVCSAVEQGMGALSGCDVVIVLDDDLRLLPREVGAVLVAVQTLEAPRDEWQRSPGPAGYFSIRDTTPPMLDAFIQVGASFADRNRPGAVAAGPAGRPLEPRQRAFVTDRERETLELLAKGMSNDEIAAHLSISTHGVKRLVGNIMVRLGAPNRTSAVVTAMREGILDCPAAVCPPLAVTRQSGLGQTVTGRCERALEGGPGGPAGPGRPGAAGAGDL